MRTRTFAVLAAAVLLSGAFIFSGSSLGQGTPRGTPAATDSGEESSARGASGVLSPAKANDVKLELKRYDAELKVVRVAAPGTAVKKGETVAVIDATDLVKQLDRAEIDLAAARVAGKAAALDLEQFRASAKLRAEKAKRDFDSAQNEFEYWTKLGKGDEDARLEMGMQGAVDRVEGAEDEWKQLENLYRGNNLAKESQDIVVKRQLRSLEQARKNLEIAKHEYDRNKNFIYPRREAEKAAAWENAKNAYENGRAREELEMAGREIALDKAKAGLEAAQVRMLELRSDREHLELKAPVDGVVVHGSVKDSDGVSVRYAAGDVLGKGGIVLSVVEVSAMEMTVSIPVRTAAAWRGASLAGTAMKVRIDDLGTTVEGKVTAVGMIVRKGRVSATVSVSNESGALLAGMSARVEE
jgi:multidrug resistance efflux pump